MADVHAVVDLLRDAAHEHHVAFADVDGADPEWPLWYAEYLAPRLRALMGAEVTLSQLVHSLLLAQEARDESGVGEWADAYAALILERSEELA